MEDLPISYAEEVSLAVALEVAEVTDRRNKPGAAFAEYGRFMLTHYLEEAVEMPGSADIAEIGVDMRRIMNSCKDGRVHDESTERFNNWEVTGWTIGTIILFRQAVIPEDRQTEYMDVVASTVIAKTPTENSRDKQSVDDSMYLAAEKADFSLLESVDEVRNLFEHDVAEDAVPDIEAFKRGLYYAFVAGQEFITKTERIDIDAELQGIVASES